MLDNTILKGNLEGRMNKDILDFSLIEKFDDAT